MNLYTMSWVPFNDFLMSIAFILYNFFKADDPDKIGTIFRLIKLSGTHF